MRLFLNFWTSRHVQVSVSVLGEGGDSFPNPAVIYFFFISRTLLETIHAKSILPANKRHFSRRQSRVNQATCVVHCAAESTTLMLEYPHFRQDSVLLSEALEFSCCVVTLAL